MSMDILEQLYLERIEKEKGDSESKVSALSGEEREAIEASGGVGEENGNTVKKKKKVGYWKTKDYTKLANNTRVDKVLERVGLGVEEIEDGKAGFKEWKKNQLKNGVKEGEKETESGLGSYVPVTASGLTLEEVLKKRRRVKDGSKRVKSYKELASVLKKEEGLIDKRYTKTQTKDRKRKIKRNRDLKRKKSKYLLKNTAISEAQRIIYKNLNLTRREMDMILVRGRLTTYEMDEMVAKGRETEYSQYLKRGDLKYINNYDILLFLRKFRWATAKIIQNMYRNRSLESVKRMLQVLESSGYVIKSYLPGGNPVYSLTTAGGAAIGDNRKQVPDKLPSIMQIPPVFGSNFIAACLWNKSYNILDEAEEMWKKKRMRWGVGKDGEWKWLEGELLISEYEIRSSTQKMKVKLTNGKIAGQKQFLREWFLADYRMSFQEWEMGGKKGPSPEEEVGREYLYGIHSEFEDSSQLHFPDLVVKRARNADGSPNTVAIEFERSPSREKLIKVLNSYKREVRIYKEVVWIVFEEKAAKMIESAAKKVGISEDKYRIIPLIGPRGIITDSNMFLM